MPIPGWGWSQAEEEGQAGGVGAEDGAGNNRLPQGKGLGMGSKTMVSCLGWLFMHVTACLILQLLPGLVVGTGQHPPNPCRQHCPPFPSLPGTAVTGEGFSIQRDGIPLCLQLNLGMGFGWLLFGHLSTGAL